MANEVYGINIPNSCFTFDKIYYNAKTAQDNVTTDGILIGRYILIIYCDTAFNHDERNQIIGGTFDISDKTDKIKADAQDYLTNYTIDYSQYKDSKDRKVYRKDYKDNSYIYTEVASLHSDLSDDSIAILGLVDNEKALSISDDRRQLSIDLELEYDNTNKKLRLKGKNDNEFNSISTSSMFRDRVNSNDRVLKYDNDILSSTVSLSYNENDKQLKLYGHNTNNPISNFSTSQMFKDRINPNDTVLIYDEDGLLKTNLTLTYNTDNQHIELKTGNTLVTRFDASAFVKDSFLSDVKYDENTNQLIFTFSLVDKATGDLMAEEIKVPIDIMDAGQGINISVSDDKQAIINIKLDTDTEDYLSVSKNGLKLSGIKEDFEQAQEDISDINTALGYLADKDVIKNEPSAKITWTNNKDYEAGTTVTLSYSINFTDGKYKYWSTTDKNNKEPNIGSSINDINVSFNGTTKENTSGSFDSITVTPTTNLTATATVSFSEGIVIPTNNLGLNYEDGKYKGKNNVSLTDASIKGYRMGCFYGNINTPNPTEDDITSNVIRGLNKSNKAYISSSFNHKVQIGTTAILIACPANETGPTYVINTTANAPMTDLYGTTNKIKTLKVKGANGEDGEDYNIWMFKPAEPYASEANLTITLG